MATITFPQVPFLDPQTGNLSLEWFMWLQNPQVASIVIGVAIDVTSGGTGLTSGTSGGILGFTSSTTMASSVALTANEIVLGGGAGTTPIPLGSLGTSSTVLHGNASGAPSFSSVVLTADVTGILAIANGGTNTDEALDGAAIMVSDGTSIVQGPKGTTTKVLHGNNSGIPQYQFVIEADQSLSDLTTWNVSSTAHGYVPKAPNDATKFLDGTGAWATPSGSWVPTVDGSEPPNFITDGAGTLIFVPYTP